MTDQTSQLATLDAETLARELDWATAANGIATLRAHGESAAADALALLAAHCEAWSRTAERRQVMLNAANAMNGVHQRTITRLREQLAQAQSAPGPAGLTRVWSGYDDDECWFPMFATLADAKAYAEQAYRAQCAAYGTIAPDELGWAERKAYTEAHGHPGLYDLETDSGFVVCELLVHPSLASGLAERPIETDGETSVPVPQVEGRQETPAEDSPERLPHEDYMQAVFDALDHFGLHPAHVTTTTPGGQQLDGVISFPAAEFPDAWPDGVYLGWDQRGGWSLCDEGADRNLWDLDLDTYANPSAVTDRARTRLLDLPDTAPDETWSGALDLRAAVAAWEEGCDEPGSGAAS